MQRNGRSIAETKGRELCNNLGKTRFDFTRVPVDEHNRMVEALEELSIPITYTENEYDLPKETPAIIFSSCNGDGKEFEASECCFLIALFCPQPDRICLEKLLNVMVQHRYRANVIVDNRPIKAGLFISVFVIADNNQLDRSMRFALRRTNKIVSERSAAEWAM